MSEQNSIPQINLALYLNRWIAIVRGRVIGVGLTTEQAQRAAKRVRPKDKPRVVFVDAMGKIREGEADEEVV